MFPWKLNLAAISPEQERTQRVTGGGMAGSQRDGDFDPEVHDPDDPISYMRMVKPVGNYGWGGLASLGEGLHNTAMMYRADQARGEQRASQAAGAKAFESFASGGGMAAGPAALGQLLRNPQTRSMSMQMYQDQQRVQREEARDQRNFDQQRQLKHDDWGRQDADPLRQLQVRKMEAELARPNLDTPDNRAKIAEQYGLQKGTPAYQAFVLTGALPSNSGRSDASNAFGKKAAESLAETYDGYVKEGQKAVTSTSDLERMQELSGALGEGKVSGWLTSYGPYLQSIGLEPRGLAEAQAFKAIASKLAPAMRPAGSGATSDKDMEIFMSSLPQLSQTREGRDLVIGQMRSFHDYSAMRSRIASAAMTGKLTPEQAEAQINALPSPFTLMRERLGGRAASPEAAGRAAPMTVQAQTPQPTMSTMDGTNPYDSSVAPVRVQTPDDARRLPSGTAIQLPDGTIGRVP